MDAASIGSLLRQVADGTLLPDEAAANLSRLPFSAAPDVLIDTHRALRTGIPEAVYAPGKTVAQVLDALTVLVRDTDGPVLATRCDADQLAAIAVTFPEAVIDPVGRLAILRQAPSEPVGTVVVITAGTADLSVAREAVGVLEALGMTVQLLTDRGVAGLHRTLAITDDLVGASVVIVCAGMEGALPSVVGGLTRAPVIAVPTSTGYGTSFEGMTALLAMLSSCSPGIGVVGIDNGFGAACLATRILLGRRT